MRRISLPLVLATSLLAACSDVAPLPDAEVPGLAPVLERGVVRAIPGAYVVVLKPGADPRAVAARAGVAPAHVYEGALTGFAARMAPAALLRLRGDRAVAYVEPDQVAVPEGTQSSAPWHLDRIDQRALPLDTRFSYPDGGGAGVYAYVFDTGLDPSHPDFGGRAVNVYDAFGGTGIDCPGHANAVAGTVGSTPWGVAKGVRLRGVRVLDCSGTGSTSGIIAAVEWVRRNAQRPAVANLSLSVGLSPSLNTAVAAMAGEGIFVSAAAGDGGTSACNVSPASEPAVFTVAASDRNDARWASSNVGSCVDAYAPGVEVRTTGVRGGTTTYTGTSASAAVVTGAAALYKGRFGDASTRAIDTWIKTWATPNAVTGNPSGTPNLLLYVGIDTWI